MELCVDHLRPQSQRHYRRTFRWLCERLPGPWPRTEVVQRFLDELDGGASVLRRRIVQSLVNRHVRPRPRGPPVVLRPRRDVRTSKRAAADADGPAPPWWSFVPVRVRPDVAAEPWAGWMAAYVLGALRGNALRRNLIRTYVTHVHAVLRRTLSCASADDCVRLTRDALARAVVDANPTRPHQQRLCRIALNHFFAGVVFRDHPALAHRLHLRARDLPRDRAAAADPAPPLRPHAAADAVLQTLRVRDHFTEAEMEALLARPDASARDALILRILAETGLRRRAVSWLQVDAVYDRAADAPRPVAAALEKGLVVRRFALGAAGRDLLAEYVRNHHPGPHVRWLFPSPRRGGSTPVGPAVINDVLLRACRAVGIRGRHTHTHAVRKFVVVRLMQAQNRIEDQAGRPANRPVRRPACRGRFQVVGTPDRKPDVRDVLGRGRAGDYRARGDASPATRRPVAGHEHPLVTVTAPAPAGTS